ncbi:ABC transporter permease [Arthrobacter sp. M4]|uniref:ABC transporter permease n=1 Tax=Arthrobacter sp. M4 TaxID=218160 RepID=UPI001CDB7EE9|nr:ABC transporter permease [Arthrobacter sp. M4]MCA4132495.1 ABC transporter permease [Arthrobacter sp. M4]
MDQLQLVLDWFGNSAHWAGDRGIPIRVLEHLNFSATALGIAFVIGFPLGVTLGFLNKGQSLVVGLVNAVRALPTLGLLTIFVILSGIGLLPVLLSLIIIAVPPILVATFEGVRGVDRSITDAAHAMGMGRQRTAYLVQVPISAPLIVVGIRNSAIQVVSTATIAAFVGIGGLGRFVFDGLASRDFGQLAGGAVLVAILALGVELVLTLIQRALTPGTRNILTTAPLAIKTPNQKVHIP